MMPDGRSAGERAVAAARSIADGGRKEQQKKRPAPQGDRSRRKESMKSLSLRGAVLIAALFLLASCSRGGGGGGSTTFTCTPNGNISLLDSIGGNPLLDITVSLLQSSPVFSVPVFVGYTSPPAAAVLAGYPPGSTDPRTLGIDIALIGQTSDNPLEFSITFDSNHDKATYNATWRFVVVDAGANVVGCQDLPVTFTIQQ
jgi:hypothetical protein